MASDITPDNTPPHKEASPGTKQNHSSIITLAEQLAHEFSGLHADPRPKAALKNGHGDENLPGA